jgi:hypothetical protein
LPSCDLEISGLPELTTCPTGVEKILLIGVPSLVTENNPGGYGLLKWETLISCIGGSSKIPIQFIVGSGGEFVPNDGDDEYNNPNLAGNNRYLIFRGDIANFLFGGIDFLYLDTGGFQLIGSFGRFDLGTRYTLIFY